MECDMQALLEQTGFAEKQITRYRQLEKEGRTKECIRLLRCRRCELVDAPHEAQRPIDLIDWAIHSLERA
ncbi:MAG: hypothetical protein IJ203_01730 [Atopobiaceae bacterium]|nr:hypothetical protein [Atopobiaceae bacterium]